MISMKMIKRLTSALLAAAVAVSMAAASGITAHAEEFCLTGAAPAKVSGLTATARSTSVTLKWKKVSGAGGYKIYRCESSTGKWKGIKNIKSGSTVKFNSNGLKKNTAYKFRVKAYKKSGGKTVVGKPAGVSVRTKKSMTPAAENGRLRVKGANIYNAYGAKFQIRGMSTHGIMWENYDDILSASSLKVLRDDWGVNTIRIAMYTEEWGGYTTDPEYARQAKAKVINGVENAKKLGMYVIIDWHVLKDKDPNKHADQAVAFFSEMSRRYKGYNNVLYEICNEPNGGVGWSSIKPYAEKVTRAIRANDKKGIIIVGTGTWSQDIHEPLKDRLSDKNTVYTLHFYAGTHTDWLRNRFKDCYSKGLPILVSEFGTCDASGNGGFNSAQTKTWLTLLDQKKVGYCNWSASDKNETASAFRTGTDLSKIRSGTSQLTQSGKLVRSWYRKHK